MINIPPIMVMIMVMIGGWVIVALPTLVAIVCRPPIFLLLFTTLIILITVPIILLFNLHLLLPHVFLLEI